MATQKLSEIDPCSQPTLAQNSISIPPEKGKGFLTFSEGIEMEHWPTWVNVKNFTTGEE